MAMASSLRVPLLLLAALLLGLAMTPMALLSSRSSLHLMGNLEDGDPNDEEVQYVVDFALEEYNQGSQDPYLFRLSRVVRVRQQVAAGMNYYLDVEIGRTTCAKDQPTQDDCPFSEEPKQLCSFKVYFRAWEHYLVLTSSRCQKV
ncbi:cystatin-C-like isoform X2 [Octodon degus]|uniref:Cystatin-C-like isoform X2 n=1 Tax=Octodon degus TaxID=10160 RepID=A0A6P6EUB4_OCTDE|nr:cystatin-C-like isoform X2 [Octodon degus]